MVGLERVRKQTKQKRHHADHRRLCFLSVAVLILTLSSGCTPHRRQPRPPATATGALPGRIDFQRHCAACHQYDGQGMGDAPPLAASPWVTGPEQRLIKIVLHGVRGRMEVSGKIYDREMPGFAPILSDAAVASLVSFVRERFGGLSVPVTPAAVNEIRVANRDRTDYWSVEELLNEP